MSFHEFHYRWEFKLESSPEQLFEWVRPHRFGVLRRYTRGPVAELRVLAELTASDREGHDHSPGTRLVYEIWVRPRNLLGLIVVPIQIGLVAARNFARTFITYDKLAHSEPDHAVTPANVEFAPGG